MAGPHALAARVVSESGKKAKAGKGRHSVRVSACTKNRAQPASPRCHPGSTTQPGRCDVTFTPGRIGTPETRGSFGHRARGRMGRGDAEDDSSSADRGGQSPRRPRAPPPRRHQPPGRRRRGSRRSTRADEDEQPARLEPAHVAGRSVANIDRLQPGVAVRGDHLGSRYRADVLPLGDRRRRGAALASRRLCGVIDLVTTISAPSLRRLLECPARQIVAQHPAPGSRDSSRSARTSPPGRRVPRAPPRSSGVPRTRRTRPPLGRQAPRPRSPCRTSAAAGSVGISRSSATRRSRDRTPRTCPSTPPVREVAAGRERSRPLVRFGGHVRLEPAEADLVAVEEAPQLPPGRVPLVGRGRSPCTGAGTDAAPGRPWGPPSRFMARRPTWTPTSGAGGDERVVVVQIDPEHSRRLGRAEPSDVEHPERDRHLREDARRVSARRSRCRRRRRACAR